MISKALHAVAAKEPWPFCQVSRLEAQILEATETRRRARGDDLRVPKDTQYRFKHLEH